MVPATERHENAGLRKRCPCPRAKWVRCKHPWHLNYMHERVHYRFPLYVYAKLPPAQTMTKSEAEYWATEAISAIHRDELTTNGKRRVEATVGLSVDEGFDLYVDDWVRVPKRGPKARAAIERLLRTARDIEVPTGINAGTVRFGNKALNAINQEDIEAIRTARRAVVKAIQVARKKIVKLRGKGTDVPQELLALSSRASNLGAGEHAGEVGIDRLLGRLRHACNWLIGKGKLEKSPFRRGDVVTVKQSGTGEKRTRRLLPGEEEALLQFAGPHLHALIRAALASCLRVGELLALRWRDVSFERNELLVSAVQEGAKKTGKSRIIPLSPAMVAVLVERMFAPDGKPHRREAYIFGTETGDPIGGIRTAWETCVLKAHNYPVERTATHALTPASQEALRKIDLHFHDLRREAGSRLLEQGWPLHEIQLMLGHTSLAQTADYLQADRILLQKKMREQQAIAAGANTAGTAATNGGSAGIFAHPLHMDASNGSGAALVRDAKQL